MTTATEAEKQAKKQAESGGELFAFAAGNDEEICDADPSLSSEEKTGAAAFLNFMHKLCDVSEAALRAFTDKTVGAESKEDESPVTEADRRVEYALRSSIRKRFPDHGIIGEEFGRHERAPGCSYEWILDPIDGTLPFMTKRPLYGTLICLAENGSPLIGVMNQPVLKKRWTGLAGRRSMCNGALIRASRTESCDKAILGTTSPDYFKEREYEAFRRLSKRCRYTVYGGNCYDYAMLAQGHMDLVAEAGLKPYDVAALIPIVTAAGGVMTDWSGKPLDLSKPELRVMAAATPKLHREALLTLHGMV